MPKRFDAAMRIKPVLAKGAQSLGDEDALTVKSLYPEWMPGVEYAVRKKALYKGVLYRCRQAHTSQADWAPDVAASLWAVIDETHNGTIEDPIPYAGNMELKIGLYYAQGGVVYLCTLDTGIEVYAPLKDLVGLYVEVANG